MKIFDNGDKGFFVKCTPDEKAAMIKDIEERNTFKKPLIDEGIRNPNPIREVAKATLIKVGGPRKVGCRSTPDPRPPCLKVKATAGS